MSQSHFQKHQSRIQEKYKLDKLETSEVNNRDKIDLSPEAREAAYWKNHLRAIQEKYGITELSVNGVPPKPIELTLEDYIREHDRNSVKGLKLSVAKCHYQGKSFNFWYSVSK